MAQQISTNTFIVGKWVVSPTASQGTHTTIQAAVTAASSGDTVYICDGTYTENITLKVGVNLAAMPSNGAAPNVIINGNCTLTGAGSVTISGIGLQTNSANLLTVSGSAASIVNLINCSLNCLNNTGISYSSSSSSSAINLYSCTGNLGTIGIGFFSHSSAGTLSISNSTITNTGASVTASAISAGNLNLQYNTIDFPISTSSTAVLNSLYNNFNTGNTTCIAITGSASSHLIGHCELSSGTSSGLTIGSLSTVFLYDSLITSSNSNLITGAGTINYSGISLNTSAGTSNITVTTQKGGTLQGGTFQAPSAGFLGEQIRTQVTIGTISLSNGSAKTIGSIALTPGIWDVSAIGSLSGTLTGTQYIVAITTTNNSLTGSLEGDSLISTPYMSTAASNFQLGIPSYRVTLTANTTYYLVMQVSFTVGTATGGGRISATRVG